MNPQELNSEGASDTSDPGQLIDGQLQLIDEALSRENFPIPLRPLIAASTFAENCVVVGGKRCDDYLHQPWFSDIIKESERWYSHKYGDALNDISFMAQTAFAIIMILGSPFKLCIPLMVCTDIESGKSFRVHYPSEILQSEDPLSFIASPPNCSQLTLVERTDISAKIKRIVGVHRSLRRALSFCNVRSDPQMKELAQSIPTHLNSAVDGLLAARQDDLVTLPYWEMHMAAEKLLKLVLIQYGKCPPKLHDLDTLHGQASVICGKPPRPDLLAKVAWHKTSIQMRYGEGTPKTFSEGLADFDGLMDFMVDAASTLQTSNVIPGADLILQLQLPWAK